MQRKAQSLSFSFFSKAKEFAECNDTHTQTAKLASFRQSHLLSKTVTKFTEVAVIEHSTRGALDEDVVAAGVVRVFS